MLLHTVYDRVILVCKQRYQSVEETEKKKNIIFIYFHLDPDHVVIKKANSQLIPV